MTWLTDQFNSIFSAIFVALLGVIAFLVRKILTNDKRVSMLEAEIASREEYRKERDEVINDTLAVIQSDIKRLIGKMVVDYQDQK